MKIPVIIYFYLKQRWFGGFKTRSQLERHQQRKLGSLLKSLRRRSPYFKNRLKKASINEWKSLPVMTKKEFMENFDRINTLGISLPEAVEVAKKAEETRDFSSKLKNATVGLSSGTTGHRGVFVATDFERFKYAGILLAKGLPGSLFRSWKIAFFLRANSNLYTAVKSRKIRFEYFDLMGVEHEHLQRLNQLRPDLLIAPPSVLRRLAAFAKSGQLKISPRRIISVAEVLEPIDKNQIEEAFATKVHQIYQATEGFLGITCCEGTLHLNEDLQIIEKRFIDESRTKFFPIITDLHRLTQPVVRYQLNDVLTLKEGGCPCGSPLTALEHIDGRADDILYFEKRDSNEWVPVYPDFLRRSVIMTSRPVEDYFICQKSPFELLIVLKARSEDTPLCQEEIRKYLENLSERMQFKPPRIEFGSEFPFTPAQKKRRVQKSWSLPSSPS